MTYDFARLGWMAPPSQLLGVRRCDDRTHVISKLRIPAMALSMAPCGLRKHRLAFAPWLIWQNEIITRVKRFRKTAWKSMPFSFQRQPQRRGPSLRLAEPDQAITTGPPISIAFDTPVDATYSPAIGPQARILRRRCCVCQHRLGRQNSSENRATEMLSPAKPLVRGQMPVHRTPTRCSSVWTDHQFA